MNLKEHIKFLRETKQEFDVATDYTNERLLFPVDAVVVYHDVFVAKERIQYVLKAQALYISMNKKAILSLASELIQDELDEAGV